MRNKLPINALTIDVEDYFHVTGFERDISRRTWGQFQPRFEYGMRRILDLLETHKIKATFYVLGWLGRRHPNLLREIDAAGHEIGSHSYWHRQVFRLSHRAFKSDLRRSCRVIEDAIGKPVTAFRAPSFSITKRCLWAFDVLSEEGIQSDSSVVPCVHDRYGIANAVPHIHRITTKSGGLWELPPAVHRWGPVRLPVGGGGYFRFFPLKLTVAFLRRLNTQKRGFTFYIHPWEFDAEQPRLKVGSRLSRIRHYLNLADTEHKFSDLLKTFRFGRVADVLNSLDHTSSAKPEVCYQAG
jgi:polysaccharide deacetylase family protein (PEP-CTERM system associated)